MDSTLQGIKSMFRHPDFGLLIIRLATGALLAIAGYNKFMGGEKVLHFIGANIKYIGLDVGSENISTLLFGICAAGAELVGGLLLIAGFLFRTASAFIVFTMLVATIMKIDTSQGNVAEFGYPMLMGLVVLGLLLIGPGKISVQRD